jgi:hypothetical protein
MRHTKRPPAQHKSAQSLVLAVARHPQNPLVQNYLDPEDFNISFTQPRAHRTKLRPLTSDL